MTSHPESDPTGLSQRPLSPARPAPPAVFAVPGTAPSTEADARRLWTMIELLEDDSTAVRDTVRRALRAAGKPALAALRRTSGHPSPKLRGRTRELLLEWDRDLVLRRLVRRASDPGLDLESSLFLLARMESPDFDARPYVKVLDALGAEVKKRADDEADDFTRPMVLAEYLGRELGFIGAEADFDHPAHIHLHRSLETKRGMPLTLSAIYLFVARRAGLDAAILPLPGHVLLRLYSGKRSLIIDPFHGGAIRRRTDCVRYLAQHGMIPEPAWFRDATDAAMFQRHVANLMSCHQNRGRTRLARALHGVARVCAHNLRLAGETA